VAAILDHPEKPLNLAHTNVAYCKWQQLCGSILSIISSWEGHYCRLNGIKRTFSRSSVLACELSLQVPKVRADEERSGEVDEVNW